MNAEYTILGLMSGSSLDGLDLALCRFGGIDTSLQWELLEGTSIPLDEDWKIRLANLPNMSALELARTDARFCTYVSEIVKDFIDNTGLTPDYLSSHGHTVFHEPHHGMTLQILNGGYLSGLTGLSVIADFRTQDVALSGQGAPLAPIVERDLFKGYTYYTNLGGICNISIHMSNQVQAYDVCPCNQVLNALAATIGSSFDENGEMASSGTLCPPLLKMMDDLPYYQLKGPKSLDNTWVKEVFAKQVFSHEASLEDKLHTVCVHISDKIASAVKQSSSTTSNEWSISRMLVTGGGAFNTFLVETIRDRLSKYNIELIVPKKEIVEFKEAILMAYMGYLRTLEKENIISSVTGGKRNSSSGAIYYY